MGGVQMKMSEQERQLVECIREGATRDFDYFNITIVFEDGAWNVEMTSRRLGEPGAKRGRGVGGTFDQAWDDVAGIHF